MEYLNLISSNVPWIGRIPTDWSVTRLKDISEFVNGYAFSSSDLQFEGDFPVIRIGDITGNKIVYSSALRCNMNKTIVSQQLIKVNDILIAMSGATVGKIGFVDDIEGNAYINQRVGIIRSLSAKYLYYVLSTDGFKNYINLMSGGSAQPNISSTMIQNFKIPKTDESTKKYIVRYLDNKCSNIDSIISDLERQIEILEKYKKSVITEAVTKGLNPDAEMKDSGINWIGEIPNHWDTTKMKFSSYMKGRIGWQGLTSKEYIDEGPYLVTGTDFNNGTINWESCVHVAEDRYKIAPEIMLKEFDLLITKDGTVGKVAIVNNLPDKATLNSGVLLIRPMVNIYEIKYLYYVLISKQFWNWFEWINNGGTTIIHLYQNVFSNFDFTLPPIEEQKQIINLLDKKVIEIDSIIEDKKQQVETIIKYKNSLIYEYVTGKKRVSQGDVNE